MYQYGNISNQSSSPHMQPSHIPTDYGPKPFVVDINKATLQNETFRTALWTGTYSQLTLMSVAVGREIGSTHPNVDQLTFIKSGQGVVRMGASQDRIYLIQPVFNDSAVFIPAGTWHRITNTGNEPLKLYSIYSPPDHPWGSVHQTQEIADQMAR